MLKILGCIFNTGRGGGINQGRSSMIIYSQLEYSKVHGRCFFSHTNMQVLWHSSLLSKLFPVSPFTQPPLCSCWQEPVYSLYSVYSVYSTVFIVCTVCAVFIACTVFIVYTVCTVFIVWVVKSGENRHQRVTVISRYQTYRWRKSRRKFRQRSRNQSSVHHHNKGPCYRR